MNYDLMLSTCRRARDYGFGGLSTGEALAAALVLDRHDVIEELGYTIAEALERIGPDWARRIPFVHHQLAAEASRCAS